MWRRSANAIARDLRKPKYRARVVKSRKIYNRKRERELNKCKEMSV